MDVMEIVGLVITAGGAVAGAFGWLFRLEGKLGILEAQLKAESEMRKIVEMRMNGFEARIWEKLDSIEKLLHQKADRE